MNMDNRSTRITNSNKQATTGTPLGRGGQNAAVRQQIWERAQRLYAIGELRLAARLFAELAGGERTPQPETGVEVVNG